MKDMADERLRAGSDRQRDERLSLCARNRQEAGKYLVMVWQQFDQMYIYNKIARQTEKQIRGRSYYCDASLPVYKVFSKKKRQLASVEAAILNMCITIIRAIGKGVSHNDDISDHYYTSLSIQPSNS